MKKILLSFAFAASLACSGCTVLGLSTATPTAATTLATAEQSATLVTQAVDLYVNSTNPSKATLLKLQQLSNTVHAALVMLEQAQVNGSPLVFASYNSAIAAFNAYNSSVQK